MGGDDLPSVRALAEHFRAVPPQSILAATPGMKIIRQDCHFVSGRYLWRDKLVAVSENLAAQLALVRRESTVPIKALFEGRVEIDHIGCA